MTLPPDLPSLTPPVLYFLISFTLLQESLNRPRQSPLHHRFPSFLLFLFSLSLFFISLFHFNYSQTHPHSLTHLLLRQESPSGPALPGPSVPIVTGPSISPSPPPTTTEPPVTTVTAVAAAPIPPQTTVNQNNAASSSQAPTLDQCAGGLTRMHVLLLLEFFAEIIFLIIRCCSTNDEDEPTCDITFRTFTFVRGLYAIPVIALNASILFIGGGPSGSCLSKYPPVQIAYAHLILYALFTISFLVFGLFRLGYMDSEKESTTTGYYGDTDYSYSYSRGGSLFPPSRTESYFRRPQRTGRTPTSTSYYSDDDPKFRMNCGCCEINL